MKDFLKKFLYFLIPFGVYIIFMIYADPYNFFNHCKLIPLDTKNRVSRELNHRFWKVVQYQRTPKSNILLGDSRVDVISPDEIRDLTGLDFYNFAYPACTLEEIIETFWYTSKKTRLENVIIGCNFNLYNKYNNKNLVKDAIGSADMVSYLLSGANVKAMSACFYDMITTDTLAVSKPNMNFEAFWNDQLTGPAAKYYKLYKYPDNYYRELKKIADYCKEQHINLILYLPPTHIDLQTRITDFQLEEEDKRFKADLASIAKVYDFDYPTELTMNRENFSDPFHLKVTLDQIIIRELLLHELHYARCLKNGDLQGSL